MVFQLARNWRQIATTALVIGACARPGVAQDGHTTFSLSFEGSLVSARGTAPSAASGVAYATGAVGQAGNFGAPNLVLYPAAGNLNAQEGTLEFWIRPHWNGGDGQGYAVLKQGDGGGMLFVKDGANNLRSIFNRYSVGGQPEAGVAINIGDWQANQWRHVAYTWSSSARSLKLYVNGSLRAQSSLTGALPPVSDSTFQIGGDGAGSYAQADLDELRISDIERSAAEIGHDFLAGLTVASVSLSPSPLKLLETWRRTPTVTAQTSIGEMAVPGSAVAWSVSDSAVAKVDSAGAVWALHAGQTAVTATFNGQSSSLDLTVTAPVRKPSQDPIDSFLTTPAANSLFETPVAIIRYIPTRDGLNVDAPIADYTGSITALKAAIDQYDVETKFMLEEMGRYHGYKDAAARHSLGYRVVKLITVYEELPPDTAPAHSTGAAGIYYPDYYQILARFNGRRLVEDLGVKEVWLWGYHHGSIAPVESDMSSPITGDVSNSSRFADDLPVYGRTYVLYNYNFTRSSNESVHDHGHQLESILSYVAQRQDGNANLFWHLFSGQDASGRPILGRCGNTHVPPNSTTDYDYWNTTPALTDIEDWNPAGSGAKKWESAATWGAIPYAWPYGRNPGDPMQHNWYIYWGQAMPGLGSAIAYGADTMTNWWVYTGDWDAAVGAVNTANGLHSSGNVVPPSITIQPTSRIVAHGQSAGFTVTATGPGVLTYQWRKGGRPLSDGPRIAGAKADTLTLTATDLSDAGGYDVVIQSGGALSASRVAGLTVLPNSADAAAALRIAAGLDAASPSDVVALDTDESNAVDVTDAERMLRAALGL
ncbi:MAG TPA: LamG-like jellyroll fold domain-containing protein [Armatimonadota bacterium]|jgi:hypothetical protein